MKPADIFGLVIRTLGFLLIIYGLWYILYGVGSMPSALLGHDDDTRSGFLDSPLGDIAWGIPIVAFGSLCFFCADWIVRLSYRHPRE